MARRDRGSLQSSRRQGPAGAIPTFDVKHHKVDHPVSLLMWIVHGPKPIWDDPRTGHSKNPKT